MLFVDNGDLGTAGLIAELAAHGEELDDEETQVLIVFRGNMVACEVLRKRDHIPFAVLADENGRAHARYGAGTSPGLYLTDRYGEIYDARRTSEGNALPDADDVLASIRHINAACPE
jgi:peroxiredoxin